MLIIGTHWEMLNRCKEHFWTTDTCVANEGWVPKSLGADSIQPSKHSGTPHKPALLATHP